MGNQISNRSRGMSECHDMGVDTFIEVASKVVGLPFHSQLLAAAGSSWTIGQDFSLLPFSLPRDRG